jgi:16S rRNA (guanine527-N7)-methyltransferase
MMTKGDIHVSRETMEKLSGFAALVEKWTARINLISKSSIPDIWERHIMDSVQLFDLAPARGHWVDLGSGGGFPGIVIAILTQATDNPHRVTLVESDLRKGTFLRAAIRELDLQARVVSDRIEKCDPLRADILSARALAELEKLLTFSERHLKPEGVALFPKGAQWQQEDAAARRLWSYECEAVTSKTNPEAAILKIKEIKRV